MRRRRESWKGFCRTDWFARDDGGRAADDGQQQGDGREESQDDKERFHRAALLRLQQQYVAVQAKIDLRPNRRACSKCGFRTARSIAEVCCLG